MNDDIGYLTFSCYNTQIYIMSNHKVAYLCWMSALRNSVIHKGAFLIHIDYHLDFNYTFGMLEDDLKIEDKKVNVHETFVKNDLNNATFIPCAMNRGLVGDGLSISYMGHEDQEIIQGDNLEQTTDKIEFAYKKPQKHSFYLVGSSLPDVLRLFTNPNKHKDLQRSFNESAQKRNVILDIDLDYFTKNDGEAMDKEEIDSILESKAFIKFLNSANVITIALEPYWCGGSENCKNILAQLNLFLKKNHSIDIEKTVLETFLSK